MKLRLLTIVALCLAMAAAVPASAQLQVTFSLAEAYPCAVGTYEANLGITDPQVFTGTCPAQTAAPGAVPGILCLQRRGFVVLRFLAEDVIPRLEMIRDRILDALTVTPLGAHP